MSHTRGSSDAGYDVSFKSVKRVRKEIHLGILAEKIVRFFCQPSEHPCLDRGDTGERLTEKADISRGTTWHMKLEAA